MNVLNWLCDLGSGPLSNVFSLGIGHRFGVYAVGLGLSLGVVWSSKLEVLVDSRLLGLVLVVSLICYLLAQLVEIWKNLQVIAMDGFRPFFIYTLRIFATIATIFLFYVIYAEGLTITPSPQLVAFVIGLLVALDMATNLTTLSVEKHGWMQIMLSYAALVLFVLLVGCLARMLFCAFFDTTSAFTEIRRSKIMLWKMCCGWLEGCLFCIAGLQWKFGNVKEVSKGEMATHIKLAMIVAFLSTIAVFYMILTLDRKVVLLFLGSKKEMKTN